MVALQSTVHDSCITLLGNTLLCNLGVNPLRETPGVRLNLAELNMTRRVVSHSILEIIVELDVVEEDIRIVIPAVEVAFHGFDGLDDTIDFLVPGENDKGGIGPGLACVRLEATGDEDFVMLLADFSAATRLLVACSGLGIESVLMLGRAVLNIPDGRRRASGYQDPPRGTGVLNKQYQNEDDD